MGLSFLLTLEDVHGEGLEGVLDEGEPLQPLGVLVEGVEGDDEAAREDAVGRGWVGGWVGLDRGGRGGWNELL